MGANHRGEESIFLIWEPITGGRRAFSQHSDTPYLILGHSLLRLAAPACPPDSPRAARARASSAVGSSDRSVGSGRQRSADVASRGLTASRDARNGSLWDRFKPPSCELRTLSAHAQTQTRTHRLARLRRGLAAFSELSTAREPHRRVHAAAHRDLFQPPRAGLGRDPYGGNRPCTAAPRYRRAGAYTQLVLPHDREMCAERKSYKCAEFMHRAQSKPLAPDGRLEAACHSGWSLHMLAMGEGLEH
eukprot:30601-Prorocentrum_minimum.AAC.4